MHISIQDVGYILSGRDDLYLSLSYTKVHLYHISLILIASQFKEAPKY